MGETRFQRNLFTIMMCFCMVSIMSIYNVWLRIGFSDEIFAYVAKEFLLVFAIAFCLDFFLVGPLVKKIVFIKFNPREHPVKFGLSVGISMTISMVFLMSVYGSIIQVGFSQNIITIYPHTFFMNFIAALPVNLLIVSPLIRFIFYKLFHKEVEEGDAMIIEDELAQPNLQKLS